jgi:hypothetical protein
MRHIQNDHFFGRHILDGEFELAGFVTMVHELNGDSVGGLSIPPQTEIHIREMVLVVVRNGAIEGNNPVLTLEGVFNRLSAQTMNVENQGQN